MRPRDRCEVAALQIGCPHLEEPGPELVAPIASFLLDIAAIYQRLKQAESRADIHPRFPGEFGDADRTLGGAKVLENIEHLDHALDRLDLHLRSGPSTWHSCINP